MHGTDLVKGFAQHLADEMEVVEVVGDVMGSWIGRQQLRRRRNEQAKHRVEGGLRKRIQELLKKSSSY